MSDIKLAIIGCGYWGENLARSIHSLGSLYAICDTDGGRLKSFVEKYPKAKSYVGIEGLLKDSKIDAVVIATPAATHYAIVKNALSKKKDVFVEKPMAMNSKEAEELVALAHENQQILMVGHILEYHPAIIELKNLIAKGDLGKINYIYSNRLNLGRLRTEENVLMSFAPHDISVILSLVGEEPTKVSSHDGTYISKGVSDTTVTFMEFPSGVKAHIFVSWLHPYKEQKLVVVGTKAMAVFDDLTLEKLFIYPHKIKWEEGKIPVAEKAEYELVPGLLKHLEPLKIECEHFIKCVKLRTKPITDGEEGLRVLRVMDACQGELPRDYFVHESSFVDENVDIGRGTKIWHFSHILKNTKIGKNCNIGQNVVIGSNVVIGNNVKIQNNVSVYDGVTLEDDIFCGPSAVFTNVLNPRSHYPRKNYAKTLVEKGVTLGANATILCGIRIRRYAFIGAGAVVTKDVPSHALVYGRSAKIQGWVCHCGITLRIVSPKGIMKCPDCMNIYEKKANAISKSKKRA
jgi:UDP-2-acetamido-3-amino-2,3-dideoxy-glucuronate N-acetyltransferase